MAGLGPLLPWCEWVAALGDGKAEASEDAAFQECVELPLDECRQLRAGPDFDLREKGLEFALDEPIQQRLFGAP